MNKLTCAGTGYSFVDPNKVPFDIVCNGFSLKETIVDALVTNKHILLTEEEIDCVADEIKDSLAIKLRLKQGNL